MAHELALAQQQASNEWREDRVRSELESTPRQFLIERHLEPDEAGTLFDELGLERSLELRKSARAFGPSKKCVSVGEVGHDNP